MPVPFSPASHYHCPADGFWIVAMVTQLPLTPQKPNWRQRKKTLKREQGEEKTEKYFFGWCQDENFLFCDWLGILTKPTALFRRRKVLEYRCTVRKPSHTHTHTHTPRHFWNTHTQPQTEASAHANTHTNTRHTCYLATLKNDSFAG